MSDKNSTYSKTIKSLRQNLSAKHKRQLILLSVLIMVSAVFDVVGLGLIIPLINLAFNPTYYEKFEILVRIYHLLRFESTNAYVIFLVTGILGFYIFKSLLGLFVNWLTTRYTIDVAVDITQKQYEKYSRLGYLDFSSIPSSLIINHVFNNTSSYMLWVINPILLLFGELFIVLFIIISIIAYNFTLFLCILITVAPATWLIYSSLKNKSNALGRALDKVIPKVYASLNNSIFGYTDIKLAGKDQTFRDRYMETIRGYHDITLRSSFLAMIPLRGYELVALLGIVVIFIYLKFISGDPSGSNALVLFAAAAYRLMPSLNRIINSLMYIKRSQTTVENLDYSKHLQSESDEGESETDVTFEQNIQFKNISFRFPDSDKMTLKNISLQIKKGEKVGFVGASGSGKTTLMNLLLRFYDETDGEILVDGVALNKQNKKAWRKLLGYVKQDIFIIDGSISENIAFGESNIDHDRLTRAIKQASLETLVHSLPDSYNSPVGEKGNKLSGGQRQRLGIARALYRNAQVLVFDEATSALDTQTETEVTEAIDKLSESQKTIFIIAHRITTLKNCDRIYELNNGEITGVYTYNELIEKII